MEQPAGSLDLWISKPLQLLPRRSVNRTITRTARIARITRITRITRISRITRSLPAAQNIQLDHDLPTNSLEQFSACPQPGLRHSSPEQRERKKTRCTEKGQKEEG